jgi:hypothetical protein
VDEFFFYCRIDVGVSSSKWTFDFKNGVQINQSICSPINNEFYLAKGTEKFILGRYLLSGMLLMLLSLRPWGGLPLAPPYWRIGVQNHIFAIISLSVRDTSI